MKIKTKFDIGQKVWVAIKNFDKTEDKVEKKTIKGIMIEKDLIVYYFYEEIIYDVFNEDWIFATKEEAEQKLKGIENETSDINSWFCDNFKWDK